MNNATCMLQIWEDSLKTVHAVEPSEAMRWLGQRIERRSTDFPVGQAEDSATADQDGHPADDRGMDAEPGVEDPVEAFSDDPVGHSGISRGSQSLLGKPAVGPSHRRGLSDTGYQEGLPLDQEQGGRTTVIGAKLSSSESSFGRSWCIRWLQHLQGFGDRKELAAKPSRRQKGPSWVQSTGTIFSIEMTKIGILQRCAMQQVTALLSRRF